MMSVVNFRNFISDEPAIVWQSYEGEPTIYSKRLILKNGSIVGEICGGKSALGEPAWEILEPKDVNKIIVCDLTPELITYVQNTEMATASAVGIPEPTPPKNMRKKRTVRKKTTKKKTVK